MRIELSALLRHVPNPKASHHGVFALLMNVPLNCLKAFSILGETDR